ncbi:MAG: hypothetical protein ABIH10_01790 [Spirochaetota bacterium]
MKSFIKKSIIFLIVFSLVFGVSNILEPPKKAEAVWGIEDLVFDAQALITTLAEWAEQLAQWAAEEAALALRDAIAKRLLDYMTDQTIEWIQGGGEPQFVTDFGGFLEDSASAAVGDVILETDAAFICSPFKAQILLGLESIPKFSEQVKCTLDDIITNIENFYDDFSQGGWAGYIEVMQPQGNYYGVALQVSANLNAEAAKAVDAASKEVQAGSGFLSVKRCKGGGVSSSDLADLESGGTNIGTYKKDSKGNYCKSSDMENITPGDTVGEAVRVAINSDSQWAANVQSVVAALINALINRLITEGLSAMSDSNSSDVDSAADYTSEYDDAVSQSIGSDQNAIVELISLFLDEGQYLLTQYSAAFDFNSEVISALEQIKAMSCSISNSEILEALGVNNIDDALVESNDAQTNLMAKVSDLGTLVLEASSTINQINALYSGETSITSTSQIQTLYADFISKYSTQEYMLYLFSERTNADAEAADKENKAELAEEALNVCTSDQDDGNDGSGGSDGGSSPSPGPSASDDDLAKSNNTQTNLTAKVSDFGTLEKSG